MWVATTRTLVKQETLVSQTYQEAEGPLARRQSVIYNH